MNWLKKLWALICGKAKKKVEDVVTPKPASTCGCDLSKPIALPPYTDAELAAMGNASECPTIGGLDIRLHCTKPNGGYWLLGQLLPKAVLTANPVSCQCFDDGELRFHFCGYTYNSDSRQSMIAAKAGDVFPYRTTTFIFYEARRKNV